VSVIPINADFIPRRSNYRAKIARRGSPANAVADFEVSLMRAKIIEVRQIGGPVSHGPAAEALLSEEPALARF
jgi:hypothetical protein